MYLNELDRFVKHTVKSQAYLRYGDDFIIVSKKRDQLKCIRNGISEFLRENLRLTINSKNDVILQARQGIKFLGVHIFPSGRRLNKRNWRRVQARLNHVNIASYSGLVKQHSKRKRIKEFHWTALEKIGDIL